MAIEVRLLRPGDEDVFADVAPGVLIDPMEPEMARKILRNPRHHLVVAIEDGRVVGFASGVHMFRPDQMAPDLFVNEVGVAESPATTRIRERVIERLFAAGRDAHCSGGWIAPENWDASAEPHDDLLYFGFELGGVRQ